jgi:hypothetical protein
MEWKKPSIQAAAHRYILAIVKIEYEDEITEEMHLLSFNGIKNRWRGHNSTCEEIKLSDIRLWIPVPDLPKENILKS